ELAALKGHTGTVGDITVLPAAGGGPRIVSVSEDGTGRIWSLRSPAPARETSKSTTRAPDTKPIVLAGHKGPVRGVVVTPAGDEILTTGDDRIVRVWNAKDGAARGEMPTGHTGPILALAVDPQGKTILTGSADGTARLVARPGGKVLRILTGHPG